MEKRHLDRRLDQMRHEGVEFRPGVEVGIDLTVEQLRDDFDAVVLAGGATDWRDLPVPGRQLHGIHQAMEFLPWANRAQEGDLGVDDVPITARDKHVVIIGGGDTGADCLGTSHRQGAASVHQLEIMPRPPDERPGANPWPTWPMIYRVSSAHEEGGEHVHAVNTEAFVGDDDGNVVALVLHEVEMVEGRFQKIEGTDFELPADLVLLALGFVGPERSGLLDALGVDLDGRGNVARSDNWMSSLEGVFVAGDMGRGQSLIVWAIAEGRARAAAAVDAWLMGATSLLAPIAPRPPPALRISGKTTSRGRARACSDSRGRNSCTLGPIVRANTTVPRPTEPPSDQPTTRTLTSSAVRTARIEPTPLPAKPVMSPSRGPGPRPAPM